MEVTVTKREVIKPSSPTPDHLRHLKLSFLDQLSPQIYMTRFLFYPFNPGHIKTNNHQERCDNLKKSLSETLSRFYPLAGRIKSNLFVDCNDEGAEYLETRVKCQLSDVLQNPNLLELNKLAPFDPTSTVYVQLCLHSMLSDSLPFQCLLSRLHFSGDVPLGVQVNSFECGGMAIGICTSHTIGDGFSFVMFINSWAAANNGEKDLVSPQFECAKLFPPMNIPSDNRGVGIIKEKPVAKRFVFAAPAMAALKEKYGGTKGLENQPWPSRVEAVSAFIWSRFVAATQEPDSNKSYIVHQSVNLRWRTSPPLPETYFGNLSRTAVAILRGEEGGSGLISKMRDSIRSMNNDYVKQFEDGGDYLNLIYEFAGRLARRELFPFYFTSTSKFPVYEADFGWGKPAWAGLGSQAFKNLAILMSTKSGDGIEAWVNLEEHDMAKFERDEELLFFASPTSSSA
ncbi:stemmadenine O-acetyltransferase-like [Diospyros lotus]|uniref:stemmadenine O-acetyltransferase-like n=1 Tax=Diospyros lotus TaxID=55363 RepID=UPI0022593490|nr:stemmadenine O-acetyltransferase-like [Diospyros lotus]